MVALLSVLWIGGIAQIKLLPPWDYSIAYQAARMWIFLPVVGFAVLARYASQKFPKFGETFPQSILGGAVCGLGVYTLILMSHAVEHINGAWDKSGHYVSLPVVAVNEYKGKHPFRRIVVERFAETEPSSEVFWAGDYPFGWNDPRNCLLARTGKGLLGLRWIADERIGPCQP